MSTVVHIQYVRSGGIGGMRMTADVDTGPGTRLDAELAARIDALASAVLSAPNPSPGAGERRDGFQYDLTLERAGERVQLRAWDPLPPGPLAQLIEALDELATPATRRR